MCHRRVADSKLGSSIDEIVFPYHQPIFKRLDDKKLMDNGDKILIKYCRTSWIEDGKTTDDEVTPFVFVNDKLIAIGWSTLGGIRTFGDVNAKVRAERERQLKEDRAWQNLAESYERMCRTKVLQCGY